MGYGKWTKPTSRYTVSTDVQNTNARASIYSLENLQSMYTLSNGKWLLVLQSGSLWFLLLTAGFLKVDQLQNPPQPNKKTQPFWIKGVRLLPNDHTLAGWMPLYLLRLGNSGNMITYIGPKIDQNKVENLSNSNKYILHLWTFLVKSKLDLLQKVVWKKIISQILFRTAWLWYGAHLHHQDQGCHQHV